MYLQFDGASFCNCLVKSEEMWFYSFNLQFGNGSSLLILNLFYNGKTDHNITKTTAFASISFLIFYAASTNDMNDTGFSIYSIIE